MNILLEKSLHMVKNKKTILIALLIFFFVELILAGTFIGSTLAYDKIYKGIYVNDVYVSGLTQNEAQALLRKTYEPRFKDMQIIIKSSNKQDEVKPNEIVDSLNIENAVNNAFNEGRKGNFISRILRITETASQGKTIPLEYTINEGKVQQLIGKYYLRVKKDLVQNSYQIHEDKIIVTMGGHGINLDEAAFRQKLVEKIDSLESGVIEIPVSIVKPDLLDIEQLHKKVYVKEKNATYQVKDYRLNIIPQVIGRDFDVDNAKKLLKAQTEEGRIFEISLSLTYPKVYEQDVKKTLFKDELSSFSTKYRLDGKRSENVRLAATSINGAVLAPGDVFSYNEVVGERSAIRGYKEAHVYVGGRITDGIGGGICQVSTTLYNAVLFADMQVVNRRNHNMTVSYVPPGRDATVAYGGVDLKFKNNYKNAVKILSSAVSGKLSIKILGVEENPSKKIEIETEIVQTYPYKETVVKDPTKPVGYTKVEQKGMNGYKANTYKIIKINGKTSSRTLISTSKYISFNQKVVKGTKIEK
jgi:vancomycin resistance protein YoaR